MQVKQGTYKGSGGSVLPLAQSEAGAAPPAAVPRCLPWQRDRGTEGDAPQLRPRWLPRGPCPTQGPSCGSAERGLGPSAHSPAPEAREFCKRQKNQEEKPGFLLPPRRGEGERHLALCRGVSRASPTLREGRAEQPQVLSARSPAPAPRSRLPEEKESSPGGWRRLPCAWAGMSVPHRVDCRSGSTMVSRSGDSM